ncbi:hypothetical protein WNZ15_22665 [Roseibium sp. AS2]|uniref:hypothetical protein n=1 Tax=Roseibium sp. AS2 TaxID=3135781 RepID=UPI003181A564
MLSSLAPGHWLRKLLPILLLPLLGGLAGCALSPATSDVEAFGKAATRASAAVAIPDQLQNELLLKIAVNRNACRYLQAGSYSLASKPSNSTLETIREQVKFVRALEAYSRALAGVAGPEGLADLRAAANGFSDQVSTVAAIGPFSPGAATVVGPVAKVLVNAVVNVSELRRRKKMKEIMTATDLSILRGARRIGQDYKQIEAHLKRLVSAWNGSARCVLTQVRASNGAGAYDLFTRFDRDYRTYRAQVKTVNKAVNLVGQIVATHQKLVESEGDFEAALAGFNQAIADFSALKQVLLTN